MKLRFGILSLKGLRKAYKKAIDLGLDEDFIKMLECEIDLRREDRKKEIKQATITRNSM
jgi:hypothetical protein